MPESSEHAQLPVLIIGSGVCGLALAHGLHNNNIPYKVLEKDASLASAPRGASVPRDWALACHWAVPTLASLVGPGKWSRGNAGADIDPAAAGRPFAPVRVLNGRTGAVEGEVPSSGDFRRFLRSRLRALIADGDGDGDGDGRLRIAYGKRLERISYGGDETVTAHFADGTAETGRLLVGADGSQSTVRRLLLPPSSGAAAAAALKRLPFGATFVNATFSRERALWLRAFHPVISIILHPDDMVGMLGVLDAADAGRPETWRFTFYISWRLTPEELAREEEEEGKCAGGSGSDYDDEVGGVGGDGGAEEEEARRRRRRRAAWLRAAKERSRSFAEPLRSCYEWLADDHEEVYYSRVANWDPSLPEHAWDNHGGLVTLVGDAAHPMTYQRGQGLNHALADAGQLVELLAQRGDASQEDLIHAYEAEMRARAGEEVRQSEMNTAMLHDWSRVLQSPLFKRGLKPGTGGEENIIPAATSPLPPGGGGAATP
ncbi:hypothetical protein F5X96DRAFT_694759 [Biscogniauxia mediterranea]|nr:hypothetical protein F5X96DRAFT_694759 [Biscogniauxia mediterranea]